MKQKNRREVALKRYAFLVAISIFTFFLAIIFLTGNLYDNSLLLVSFPQKPIDNYAGFFGSSCIAILVYLFGSSIILIIPLLIYKIVFFAAHKKLKDEWDVLLGFIFIFLASCMWGPLYRVKLFNSPFCYGGIFGTGLCNFLLTFFNPIVLNIIVISLMFSGFVLVSRLWFVAIVMYVLGFMKNKYFYSLAHISADFLHIFFTLFLRKPGLWLYAILKDAWTGDFIIKSGESLPEFEFGHLLQQLPQTISDKKTIINNAITEHPQRPEHHSASSPTQQNLSVYQLPPRELWKKPQHAYDQALYLKQQEVVGKILEEKLERFGVKGSVVAIKIGPVVTLFEYQPHIDAKLSKIMCLEDDLSLALQALSIRIIAPIPGKSVVGFEVSNKVRTSVFFSTIVQSIDFIENRARLPLILGVSTIGAPIIVDLSLMPHLLLAGTTGSGKSVSLNGMLMSLLCAMKPKDLNLILIDPKRLEFSPYADIPHLIFPIVTDAHRATNVLRWVVTKMSERYELLAQHGLKTIYDYHRLAVNKEHLEAMPFIVVIIDELADLMMVAGKDIEESIARITQMARAAGIHLIVATQRPSVDVITGTIKVNFPARISCKVSSKIDSRTILDCSGAEKLLGKGDMLYLDSTASLQRVHGAFISDDEIKSITNYMRLQQKVVYTNIASLDYQEDDMVVDDKKIIQDIIEYIQSLDEISISLLQRKFRIGYNRSARIIDYLEAQGLIMTMQGGKSRKVVKL